jgi:ANTAR domain
MQRVRGWFPDCMRPSAPGSFDIVDAGSDDSRQPDIRRLALDEQWRRLEASKLQLQATIEQIQKGRSRREILHHSAFARLHARLESMPVIEQAKGILMAEHRCGPDEAFDLLRRASQRANIKVNELAAQIVEQVASPGSEPALGPAPLAESAD